MEPLSTALIAAIAAAAGSIAGGMAEAAGGDAWAATRTRLAGWLRLDERRRREAFDRAVSTAVAAFRRQHRPPPDAETVLALFTSDTPEARRFQQAAAAELLLSGRPDLGRLLDSYRRELRFAALLRRQPAPPWPQLEPALLGFFGLLRQALAREKALQDLQLGEDAPEPEDQTSAGQEISDDTVASLRRIEALLAELAALPRISAAVNAGDGATVSGSPITVVMGDHHSYPVTLAPPPDLDALYRQYCAFLSKSFGTLDFRGIAQVQNVVRLRLEEVYVPLNATTKGSDYSVVISSTGDGKTIRALNAAQQFGARLFKTLVSEPHSLAESIDIAKGRLSTRPLHDLVREHPFLVVLGDPGAGKSTLVRAIMLALAEGRAGELFGLHDEWLPIFFPVAAFAEVRGDPGSRDLAPLAYFRDYYRGREQPDYTPLFERALLAGRALVLFDGLDEVRDKRLEITRCLGDFIIAWDAPGNRFVATSRIAGYDDAPLDAGLFTRVTVEPFNDDEIERFAANWSIAFERAGAPDTATSDPELRRRAEARTRDLSTDIFANPSVTELARNPLLLTILALIHNQGTRLPDRRVDLYRLCVEALAETWNRARNLAGREFDIFLGDEKLDERFVVNLLGPAALWIHEENPGGIVEERDLERKLAETLVETDGLPKGKAARMAADFLRLVNRETGLLQERGDRRYSFLHLTFEEYLAARALIESAMVTDADAEIHRRSTDSGWREVLRLALASVSQKEAQRLLLHLLEAPAEGEQHGRPVVLAGECLLDIGRNGATRRAWAAVVEALLALLRDTAAPVVTRVEAGHVLGRLGDPRLLNPRTGEATGLGDYELVEPYWCPVEAGPFWFGDERVEDDEDEPDGASDDPNETEDKAEEDQPRPPRFDSSKLQRAELPHSFKIGRYPVTNAEFAAFLAANGPEGYDPEKPWWTDEGRRFLAPGGHPWDNQEEFVRHPRLWDDTGYNGATQPVVGLSWYEAAAYCRWLTAVGHEQAWLPKDEEIRLPTSLEWERAARHTDQRPYPWGNTLPTADHANFSLVGIERPSPVGCFPAGRGVCGTEDLVGNVLEWLATVSEEETSVTALRPKKDFTADESVLLSFIYYGDSLDQICCGARDGYYPDDWYNNWSFRVVQSRALIE
jgi:formylglycine-generating enzyme required for sulfatase activity